MRNFKLHCKKGLPRCIFGAVSVLILAFLLSSCQQAAPPQAERVITKTVFAFDTVASITTYEAKDEPAAEKALASLAGYELLFSRTDPKSELYQLNAKAGTEVRVSDALFTVLETAWNLSEATDGAFDITLGAVSDLYAFGTEAPRVPSAEELAETLSHTGFTKIRLNPAEKTVLVTDPDLVIDLGAIAKGYVADCLKSDLIHAGVRRALINLGGNILLIGSKDGRLDPSAFTEASSKADGLFTIGIKDPDSEAPFLKLYLAGYSVVTSGTYERSFLRDGTLYHHILDPKTGLPVWNDLLSVSIVTSNSCLADALSTACFVLGETRSRDLLKQYGDITAIFIGNDRNIRRLSFASP